MTPSHRLHLPLVPHRPAHSAQFHHEGTGAAAAHRAARALRHHHLCHHRTRAVPWTHAQDVLLPGIWSDSPPLPGQDTPPPLAPRPHPVRKETHRNSQDSAPRLRLHPRANKPYPLRPNYNRPPLANCSAVSQDFTHRPRACWALKTPSSRPGRVYSGPSSRPQPEPCLHPFFQKTFPNSKTPSPDSCFTVI